MPIRVRSWRRVLIRRGPFARETEALIRLLGEPRCRVVRVSRVRPRVILVLRRREVSPGLVLVLDERAVRVYRAAEAREGIVRVVLALLLDPTRALEREHPFDTLLASRRIVLIFDAFAKVIRGRTARHGGDAPSRVVTVNGGASSGTRFRFQRTGRGFVGPCARQVVAANRGGARRATRNAFDG